MAIYEIKKKMKEVECKAGKYETIFIPNGYKIILVNIEKLKKSVDKYQKTEKFKNKVKNSYRERYQNDEEFRKKEIARMTIANKRRQLKKKEEAEAAKLKSN
jgi:hypothetical protein